MKKNIKLVVAAYIPPVALKIKTRATLLSLFTVFFLTGMVACKNGNNNTSTQATHSSDSLRTSMDSLASQNNASHAMIDEMKTRTATLDSQIALKDAEIAKLDKRIKSLERSNRSMKNKLKKDNKLIASLREELSDKDKSFADRIGLLEADKNDLIRQRDSLMAKYTHIKELGSVLHASDIKLVALHLKRNGTREKNTHRARKADVLRVSFDIDENRIADDGVKKLYLVIKDPSGNLLSDPSDGSGTTTASDGTPLSYSLLKEVPLKQNEPVYGITANWKQDADYKKGEYSIAIYNGGYKIGGGKVLLN